MMIKTIGRIKTRIALSAALLVLSSAAQAAFYPHGFYFGLGVAGANMQPDDLKCQSGTFCALSNGNSVKMDSKGSPGAVAHIGYMFSMLPVQIGLSYQYFYRIKYDENNVITQAFSSNSATVSGSGDAEVTNQTVFANVTLNGNFFNFPVVPFVLGGYGANLSNTKVTYNGSVTSGGSTTTLSGTSENQNDIERAWQVGGGFYYKMTSNLLLTFTYKYQDLGETTWKVGDNKLSSGDLHNQQGEISLIYVFGDQHQPPSLMMDD